MTPFMHHPISLANATGVVLICLRESHYLCQLLRRLHVALPRTWLQHSSTTLGPTQMAAGSVGEAEDHVVFNTGNPWVNI